MSKSEIYYYDAYSAEPIKMKVWVVYFYYMISNRYLDSPLVPFYILYQMEFDYEYFFVVLVKATLYRHRQTSFSIGGVELLPTA